MNDLVKNVQAHIMTGVARTNRQAPFRFSQEGQATTLMGFRNGVLDVYEYAKFLRDESHGDYFTPCTPISLPRAMPITTSLRTRPPLHSFLRH